MADLTDLQSAQTVKIVGANSSGVETNPLNVDSNGSLYNTIRDSSGIEKGISTNPMSITPIDGIKNTYSSAINTVTLAASPTDIFTITGSATKTIRILQVNFTGSTTSNSGNLSDVRLIKRSTANSGGTSTTPVVVPFDSTSPAGTAVVTSYTANPTLGTTVGILKANRVRFQNDGGGSSPLVTWEFGNRPGKAIILRGTSEVLAINLNGVSITGGIYSCDIEWTEE